MSAARRIVGQSLCDPITIATGGVLDMAVSAAQSKQQSMVAEALRATLESRP